MNVFSVLAILGAIFFALFHVPAFSFSRGKLASCMGVTYHLLLLPLVSAAPSPQWATMAGMFWMLADAALDAATFTGLDRSIAGRIREGLHVCACVWIVATAVSVGNVLLIIGPLFSFALIGRMFVNAYRGSAPSWLLHLDAVLNVVWIVALAYVLR